MTGTVLVVSSLRDPGTNDVKVLANKSGTALRRYITPAIIAACVRVPGSFRARQTV